MPDKTKDTDSHHHISGGNLCLFTKTLTVKLWYLTSGSVYSEDMRNLCSIFDSLQDRNRYYFFEFNGKPILTSWIWNNLRKTIRDNGLENLYNFRPYDFRHLFASRTIMKWIDNKQDVMKLLPYLSVYMGHSDIKYTMYYVHLLPERLKKTSGIDWTIFNQIYRGIDNEDS